MHVYLTIKYRCCYNNANKIVKHKGIAVIGDRYTTAASVFFFFFCFCLFVCYLIYLLYRVREKHRKINDPTTRLGNSTRRSVSISFEKECASWHCTTSCGSVHRKECGNFHHLGENTHKQPENRQQTLASWCTSAYRVWLIEFRAVTYVKSPVHMNVAHKRAKRDCE